MIGVVVFSFSEREEEPSPCNRRLARAAERIIRAEARPVIVVSQWETTLQLEADGIEVYWSVELLSDGSYLDSDTVWAEACKAFREYNVVDVIPICHPFLHMHKVRRLIEGDGFTVLRRPIGHIGFDRHSLQPWTRGPVRLLIYAMRQYLTGNRGFAGRQTA